MLAKYTKHQATRGMAAFWRFLMKDVNDIYLLSWYIKSNKVFLSYWFFPKIFDSPAEELESDSILILIFVDLMFVVFWFFLGLFFQEPMLLKIGVYLMMLKLIVTFLPFYLWMFWNVFRLLSDALAEEVTCFGKKVRDDYVLFAEEQMAKEAQSGELTEANDEDNRKGALSASESGNISQA